MEIQRSNRNDRLEVVPFEMSNDPAQHTHDRAWICLVAGNNRIVMSGEVGNRSSMIRTARALGECYGIPVVILPASP